MEVYTEGSSNTINVQITCQVRVDSEVAQIPVRVVADESIAIKNPIATIQNQDYKIDLKSINQRVAKGNILGLQFTGQDSLIDIIIRYELDGLDVKKTAVKAIIPVLFIDWRPAQASADAFTAIIHLSKDQSLRSIFPAMNWKKHTTAESDEYSFDLQTIPAWISFKLLEGEMPFFSIELLVDLGVILVLIILMAIGWQKFRHG